MNEEKIRQIYDSIEIPIGLSDKINLSLKNESSLSTVKVRRYGKRKTILIFAAVFVCLTMLVSATTIIYNVYNNMYMIPNSGIMDDINENVRSITDVIGFGDMTVEMAVSYEKDGVRMFNMLLRSDVEKPTLDRDMYENLKAIFPDGSSIILNSDFIGHSGGNINEYESIHRTTSSYEYENFPAFDTFILKNERYGYETEIDLLPPDRERKITVTDNGIKRIKVLPAAKNSSLYSYNIETLIPSALESEVLKEDSLIRHINLRPNTGHDSITEVMFKNGEKTDYIGDLVSYGIPVFAEEKDYAYYSYGEFMLDKKYNSEIKQMKFYQIKADISFKMKADGCDKNVVLSVPLPKDGETIEFETPHKIGGIGEFEFHIETVERKGNKLNIKSCPIKYSGNEDLSDIYFAVNTCSTNGTYINDIPVEITDENAETIEVELNTIWYTINGEWVIDFD